MADVFLLGAGFSKAIARTMPTMAELYQLLEPLIGTADGFTRDAYEYAGGNVETLLSYYAIPGPHDDMVEVLRKRRVAALIEIGIGALLQQREEAQVKEGLNSAGIPLVSTWHRRRAHVLTTNYDLLVERLLDEWSTLQDQTEGIPGSGDIHPVPLRSALTRDGTAMWGSSYPETFTLYKLHGSINWYKSGIETNTDEIFTLDPKQNGNPESQRFVGDKRRFIVPPVYDKSSLLNHEGVRNLWWQAKMKALAQADVLYVIGYSLPETDTAMRTLLWEGRRLSQGKRRIPLYVVDVDARVPDRYVSALGDYYDVRDSYAGAVDAFERFVGSYADGG